MNQVLIKPAGGKKIYNRDINVLKGNFQLRETKGESKTELFK